ncbi:type II toxin-antitoxin system VapC family toxin [Candidatus Bathyarchaeota archaeon]|nr:type II toxin-antitoxin system VapC family toxin [Candidatus Bathyarchaeota archaeon]
MIYVDANYWIYWFDQRLSEHKHVIKTMRSAIHEGIVLNMVTLMEVAHYFRRLSEEDFHRRLSCIRNLATLKFINLDLNIAELAFEQLIKYAEIGIGGRDSVILATMITTDTKRIATHDEVFKKVENLEVVDSVPQSTAKS